MTKRTKKKMAVQQIVGLHAMPTHHVIIWARQWLAACAPPLQHYGILRMVRDVFTMRGRVHFEGEASQSHLHLDEADHLAAMVARALRRLLKNTNVSINLGEI